ncbi:MAG: lipid-A-disaccharide synthase [Marivirga sp.]|jgi:lipid-A-disaccharide synthase
MKYYIIAGERSGDLHGGNLIKALKQQDADADIRCWGGEAMAEAGGSLVVHYKEMAFMGFLEVLANLPAIRRRLQFCKKDILSYQPDALILIDYAGFNMRIAKFAHQHGIKVHYYISPKVWAWNQKRALKIKRFVDHMYVILPFEKDFFQKFNYEVDYVGNPLLDAIRQFVPIKNFKDQFPDKPIVAILPGSRKQEVLNMLNSLLRVIAAYPTYHFVIAGVSNLDQALYEEAAQHSNCSLVFDQAYDLLHVATAALVTSGTATLETALFQVPQVVCYKTSRVSYWIGKQLIRVNYISLVNLIMDKEVVKELIQDEFTADNLKSELEAVLSAVTKRDAIGKDYQDLKTLMGDKNTSEETARLIVSRTA